VIVYIPVASADLVPWNDHAAHFNFIFGNEIDTLFGFLYIHFTGKRDRDGVPKATHYDGNTPLAL
jgi:hypothetical protein